MRFGADVTQSLQVLGALVQIDATNLSYPYLNLDNVAQDKTKPIQARLLPGSHHLQANGALLWFSVGNDGNVSYDASLEGIFTGRGTKTLRFTG